MEKQAWLIRPKPHGKERLKEFLETGFIAVGWPGIGDLTGMREGELRQVIMEKYGSDPSALAALKMMVYRMQPGDYVVVPHEGIVYFGRIASAYQYDMSKDNQEDGYPHQRKVDWFPLSIAREDLPLELQKSTRVVRVASELSQHINILDNIINNNKSKNISNNISEYNNPDSHPITTNVDLSDQLLQKALEVLAKDLKSDDPDVRLRAAQVVLESMGKKK